MEIIKNHYAISKPVRRWSEIKAEAERMKAFCGAGQFKGLYNSAYAIAHTQVCDKPMSFFIVTEGNYGKIKDGKLFESWVIINPKILKAPLYKPTNSYLATGHTPYDGEIINRVPNSIECQEACMSFPFRKTKRITRYDVIEVSYQIPGFFGLKTIKRTLSGFPSEIFQHEFDHTEGRNIFMETEKPYCWWAPRPSLEGDGRN